MYQKFKEDLKEIGKEMAYDIIKLKKHMDKKEDDHKKRYTIMQEELNKHKDKIN